MKHPCSTCTRRQALTLGALGTAALLLPACGPADLSRLDQPITLSLADYPTLTNDGGIVRVSASVAGHTHAIFVQRVGDAYRALSAECNHTSCNVDWQTSKFVCPCHGAEFAADGALLKGPATLPLLPFDVTVDADAGTLTLDNAS